MFYFHDLTFFLVLTGQHDGQVYAYPAKRWKKKKRLAFMNPDERYHKARPLLQKKYGDPYKISVAYINKAMSWYRIGQVDSHSLKK